MPELSILLDAALRPGVADDVKAKLFYLHPLITGTSVSADRRTLTLTLSGPVPDNLPTRARALALEMEAADLDRATRVLEAHAGSPAFDADPLPALEAAGEILRFDRGRVGLGPALTALMRRLERRFATWGEAFGCRPRAYPTLFALNDLHRCGHLGFFPHSVSFVGRFREDLDAIRAYAAEVRAALATGRPAPQPPTGACADAEHVLSPAVCYHVYRGLQERRLPGDMEAVWATGKCFRYESGNLTGIDRLWDFTMQELVFVGESARVLKAREALMARAAGFAKEAGLAFNLQTANDPFFIDQYAARAAYQEMFELKFELRLALPHLGRDLAAASFNYHQDYFGSRFGILAASGPAHTACAAFGLERWAYAVACQFGPEPSRWPAVLREEP